MKTIGGILILAGVALLAFLSYSYLKERGRAVSPIPETPGVKVI